MPTEYNPKYIHHTNSGKSSTIRELVFGMEDGMVSTLGAITGIAAATGDYISLNTYMVASGILRQLKRLKFLVSIMTLFQFT